jgi:NADPH:quinone reductase-like Zn-dependent oxidoreductase
VLVRNRASSINFGNAAHVLGTPIFVRAFTGILKPAKRVPGGDISGVVDRVGADVVGLQPGDAVIGDVSDAGMGAYADHVCAAQELLVAKPADWSFQEAATLPLAASVAYAALTRKGGLEQGQQVLIVGGTGSVGSFAVQIAHALGGQVTAVCSGDKADYVRGLGADEVIDYHSEDFAEKEHRFDLILAVAGFRRLRDYRRALSPTGTYVNVGGTMKQFGQAMTVAPVVSLFSKQRFTSLGHRANQADLRAVADLAEAGKLVAPIDRVYPLAEIREALRYYAEGHPAGKIVVAID